MTIDHESEKTRPPRRPKGELDRARVERWRKLAQEVAMNSGAAAVRRIRPEKAGYRR